MKAPGVFKMEKIAGISLSHVPQWLKLVEAVGWDQTQFELETLIRLYPEYCIGVFQDDCLIASAAASVYGKTAASINMVIVRPDCRGRGLAGKILEELIRRLGHCSSITLQATEAGRKVYRKIGFVQNGMECKWTANYVPAAEADDFECRSSDGKFRVLPMTEMDLDAAVEMDQKIFGVNRGELLTEIFRKFPDYAFKAEAADGEFTGFALGRQGAEFRHISPLEAVNQTSAELLFSASLKKRAGRIIIDVPEGNAEFIRMVASAGFVRQRELYTMYRGNEFFPALPECYYIFLGGEFF